jgi:thiol-disulfide isomerase/thioredoxin
MRSVRLGLVLSAALLAAAVPAIVADVRASIAAHNFAEAEKRIDAYRSRHGVTAEMLEARSWIARGALAAKDYARAETHASETYRLSAGLTSKRPLDQDRSLPVALGAAIEVRANVMAARGERSAAVAYLRGEERRWRATSIRTRIRKNLNLLALEGKPAPPIATRTYAGAKPPALRDLRGKPVVLFFWAHWCGDCRREAPVLERLGKEFAGRVAILAPTRHYGYVAGGEEARPDVEFKYIGEVWARHYASGPNGPWAPVDDETFKNYGASTTPTIVLVDARGIVRLYHPGNMSYEELKPRLDELAAGK